MKALEVRHSDDRDIEQIRQIYAEPAVYANTLQLPLPSAAAWTRKLGVLPDGAYSFVACDGGEVLGQLALLVEASPRRRHVANIGMGVKGDARRRGVGSALMAAAIDMAERWLAIRRIELSVYTDNKAAIGLYRKFGFVVDGTFREYAFRDGTYVDVHAMSRLAQQVRW
ncbi:GNAT family N-acetyltransferase [Solimonas terrae]|uniref:GNAT family N-acetyltransferase n=1 Tax=Solimonas terrae TaxID=1396819 RepID=A0A6M2BN88_9GAMM|nr:GNAT family N-acetyltransferase [Solimonas terrae]NGY03527.1 GNAT family N-acetyltransferase [Solimonas terrae]